VRIIEKTREDGIAGWPELVKQVKALPHVQAAAASLYGEVLISGPGRSTGAVVKGVRVESEMEMSAVLKDLKSGSLANLEGGRIPGIILGSKLAENIGAEVGDEISVISPQREMTPFGPKPTLTPFSFGVAGIFESGFYDLDSAWAYATLESVQNVLFLSNVVNAIELRLDDIYKAPEIAETAEKMFAPRLAATNWQEQNRHFLNALKMERVVTIITIGLIQLVAALNILITLVMMVMEKHKDIAILMSMGARRAQIQKIFMMQGVMIGAVGAVIGLAAGYTLSYLADRYRWVQLDQEVYALAFVPFEPRWIDGIWIAAAAIAVSFVATIHPARSASRIAPVESLRYE
jgi:lipoprotein-releasing system permease protein